MEALLSPSILHTLLLVVLVVAVDALWCWPERYHPLTLFRLLAEGMAKKVKPDSNESPSQHRISGALGAMVLIVPFTVLTGTLVYFAEYPLFFEGIVLFSTLDFGHSRRYYKRVTNALGQNKKILARDTLKHLVARDCDRLSDIGIAKAAMESYLLRFYYQFCGVLLWFLIAGPVAALLYRLTLSFAWQWHWRRPGFYWFTMPVRAFSKVTGAIPAFTGALLFALVSHPVAAVKALRQCKPSDATSRLLAISGGGLHVRLGGPALYHGNMVRYQRVGGSREVRFSDMTYCRRAVSRAILLLLGILTVIFSILYVLQQQAL